MILLTCAKIPDKVDKATLLSVVSMLFCNEENAEYLKNIVCRSNTASANESLFALCLLYELLTELPRPANADLLRLARNENGKPYFKNSSLHFSVSHSCGYVACALSDEGKVGIDLEASTVNAERARKIAERYFNDDEKELIRSSPESFLRIWCEKEAKAKFYGSGLGIYLQNEKKSELKSNFFAKSDNVSIHRFYYDKIPISLCAKDKFGTIVFLTDNGKR
jgi:phosphopantetheinyl transferase